MGTGDPFARVTVSIDGTEIGDAVVDENGNWTVPVTSPLADGPHTATATQTDLAGNESAADNVNFTVDSVAPDAPVITAPTDGSTTGSTPDIVGTGEPGATVTVFVDSILIGDAEVDEDGNWSVPLTTPLADGPHSASAVQIDSAGNESAADEVDFVVAAAAPVITNPDDGSTTGPNPVVCGTGEPGATIVLRDEDGKRWVRSPSARRVTGASGSL